MDNECCTEVVLSEFKSYSQPGVKMASLKKSKATLTTLRPKDAELVAVGVEAAALVRRARELESNSLNYFFEMAWHAVYQEADEVTRVAIMEAVEADLSREVARMRKAS